MTELTAHPARPLSDWPPVAALLVGTQTRLVSGATTTHRVIEAGDGPPLILVHGVGGHAEVWARNMHALAENFHVYAVDALFHGLSTKEPWVEDMAVAQADALADLVGALGHDRVSVEGESMGAMIAYEFGARHPHLVDKVVLNTGFGSVAWEDPALGIDPAGFAALRRLSATSVLDTSFAAVRARMEWLVADPTRMTDDMVAVRQAVYRQPGVLESLRRVYHLDEPGWHPPTRWTEADVARYPVPAMVFWTEHNPGQTVAFAERAARILPDSAYHLMRDAGHWPQWEKPEEHDAVVTEYLLG